MDTTPIPTKTLENYYHISGEQLEYHYKNHLSQYSDWEQKEHADKWLLFPENIGEHISIDETYLSNGKLYTIVTNKASKGRKGTLIAIISGTKSEDVIEILDKIPETLSSKVKEVTLDMAESMRKIIRNCFPLAERVIDRFHVQKLAFDGIQEMRIAHRWDAINKETDEKENAKLLGVKYRPEVLSNGDTLKQLLVRSRYLLI